jgi:4-amino-4-deoxy-L-arabinose transferase-like glycosyltransferase
MSLTILTLLYLVIRLTNLTIIPIFTDEAMYLRWSQIGLFEPQKYLFISLIDGKQPFFVWLTYPFVHFMVDPLVAGRLVSVLTGLVTMIFLYLFTRLLFSSGKIPFLTAVLYLIFPFAVVYDRLAVMDSLLAATFMSALYFQLKLVQKPDLKNSVFTGIAMGLGLLTKSSAIFFIILAPLSLIFIKEKAKPAFFRWLRLFGLAAAIALTISSILYLSPLHGMITMKNEVFVYTLPEFFRNPLNPLQTNLPQLLSYFPSYFGTSWITLIFLGLLVGFLKKEIHVGYLFMIFFIPFLALAVFGRLVYPRFIFFMVLPLLPVIAYTSWTLMQGFKKPLAKIIFVFVILAYPMVNSAYIVFQPTAATLPSVESGQLLNSWPAGYGVKEVVAYVTEKSKTGKVFLATEGTQGLFPYALELYLYKNKNVTVKGYWPVSDIPAEVRAKAKTELTYFIYKDTLNPLPQKNTKAILKVRRGIGNNYLRLLKIYPESTPCCTN